MTQYDAVKHVSNIRDLLKPFGDCFSRYSNDDCHFSIDCKWKCDVDSKTLHWVFDLMVRNMKQLCLESSLGWEPKRYNQDLHRNWARYLIVLNADKRPVAYSMFRFDVIQGYSVLFCYQLQIEKQYQRMGIGRFLINAMEQLATYYNMEKLGLMVLLNNRNAVKFYRRMDFEIDESTPILEKRDFLYLKKDTHFF